MTAEQIVRKCIALDPLDEACLSADPPVGHYVLNFSSSGPPDMNSIRGLGKVNISIDACLISEELD